MATVTVLGAGPTGLWAAWKLAEVGHDVTVLERAARVGGMAASIEVAGQSVDLGSHRLHPVTPPALLSSLARLLGDDLQVRRRHGRIRVHDRWLSFPLRPGDLVRQLPAHVSARIARDALCAPLRRTTPSSFAGTIRAGLGPTVANLVYEPYAAKLWGRDGTELDPELARRRVSTRTAAQALGRALRRGDSPGRTFLYPRLGYGQIVDRVAQAAVDAGATITLDCAVESVEPGGRVRTDTGAPVDADLVVSTLPVPALTGLDPNAPPAARTAAAALRYRGMVLVYLACDTSRYTEFDAHYLPQAGTPIARLSEPKNYRDGPDPADRTVLCAELPCTVDDEIWRAGDDALATQVTDDLIDLGLPTPKVSGVATRRLPTVYPVYPVGYRTHLDEVDRWLGGRSDLLSVGRGGLFVPDNLHHCLAMAERAATAIGDDGSIDRDAWARARLDFEHHIVED